MEFKARSIVVLAALTFSGADAQELEGFVEGASSVSNPPSAPTDSDYSALRLSSPFSRVLNPADIFTLRGFAVLDELQVATLYNRETKKSLVVTPESANKEGIHLVQVVPGNELEAVTATISFAGEEVELKYELEGLFPRPRASQGSSSRPGEPERKGPSQQDVDRYKSLSEENRNKLRQYIGHVMKAYPNISRDERGNMIRGAMIRLTDGRGLEVPAAGESGASQSRPPQGR
tara:strand:- start:2148 stop:2846 length:699 start_codon:yes stop_codon:yes gene_type:complete